jgi:hypothetical protein
MICAHKPLHSTALSDEGPWHGQIRVSPCHSEVCKRTAPPELTLTPGANLGSSYRIRNRCLIAGRYIGAERRWRRRRKCGAKGPYAARKRWACPGGVHLWVPKTRRNRRPADGVDLCFEGLATQNGAGKLVATLLTPLLGFACSRAIVDKPITLALGTCTHHHPPSQT